MTSTGAGAYVDDMSRPLRTVVLLQMLGLGLLVGALLNAVDGVGVGVAVLGPLGLVLFLASFVGFAIWMRRADARLRTELAADVEGSTVPARAVRQRPATRGTASVVVATALTADGARRVAALVPEGATFAPAAPLLVRLDPARPGIAAVDADARPHQLRSANDDPRWSSLAMPTERSVAGGYAPLLGFSAIGAVVGIGIGLLVRLLAG